MNEFVTYVCSCSTVASLPYLHFCRHCMSLKCGKCLYHELDVVYCPTCLDTQSREESDLRENRCASCFACPNCGQCLSVRATLAIRPDQTESETSQPASTDAPPTPGGTHGARVYYLTCNYCRWSSRDAGIRDQVSATGGWQEETNPNLLRIQQLCEAYNLLCIQEKMEQERQNFALRRKSTFMHERLGFASFSRRRGSVPPISGLNQASSAPAKVPIPAAEASDEVPPLDVDRFLEKTLNLDNVVGMQQRLLAPHRQPELSQDLYPRRRGLLANRSLRCRVCEHNVSKHDRVAKSMKFKINCNALYHVPQLRLWKAPATPWKMGQSQAIVITLFNPATRVTTVSFSAVQDSPDEYSTAKLVWPEGEFAIAPRSDAAEMVTEEPLATGTDPSAVAFRQLNKLGLLFQCTPMVSAGKPVRVSFCLSFDVKNILHATAATLSSSVGTGRSIQLLSALKAAGDSTSGSDVPELARVTVRVRMELGTVTGS